jgi:transposase
LGLLLSAAIHPADIQDRDGAVPLLRAARRLFPFVEVIFADGAYRGEATAEAVARTGRWRLEIVKRGDSAATARASCPCPSAGSWSGPSLGSGAAAGSPRTSRTSPSTRSPSSASA